MNNFLTHLFIVLFAMVAVGIAVALIGLVWYGAFVIWGFVF